MKIGIIGAENSHSAAIAATLNVKKSVPGFTVDYIWGETDEFAKASAEKGAIPNIVAKPSEMQGKIDALIVCHRHARHHLKAASPFLGKGIPFFIDKPFCYRSEEGERFLEKARKTKTPVTSFSTIPTLGSFRKFKNKAGKLGALAGGATYGSGDVRGPYGGVFFYGIHQLEMAGDLFGYDVKTVLTNENRQCSTGQLLYANGATVTLNFFKQFYPPFSMSVVGEKGVCQQTMGGDADPYLAGIKIFTKMFRTGLEPRPHGDILQTVRILEALDRSLKSHKPEKV